MSTPWTYEIAPNGYHVKDADGIVLAVTRKADVAKRLTVWPDMLAALRMIATYCEANRPVLTKAEMGKIARAAIAKAEGRTPHPIDNDPSWRNWHKAEGK